MNYFKTGFEYHGILQYRVVICGVPLNTDLSMLQLPNKYNMYSESIIALMEAWSVHQKTEGSPTLLTLDNYCPAHFDPTKGYWQHATCAIFGQELENFNQKSSIIQSGVNNMQTMFVLEINCSEAAIVMNTCSALSETVKEIILIHNSDAQYELRAFCMHNQVIAFNENSGSVRTEY